MPSVLIATEGRVGGNDQCPKRDRAQHVTNDKSASVPWATFFYGVDHQKADGRSPTSSPVYEQRMFHLSRWERLRAFERFLRNSNAFYFEAEYIFISHETKLSGK